MAVLLVNQHTVPIFIDIANAFVDAGHQTILFTGHIEKGGKPLSDKVKVIHAIRYKRNSTLTRLVTWVMFTVHYFFYLIACKKPIQLLVVTNPPLAPLVTGIVSWWRKLSYHVLIYDLYPEVLSQTELLRSDSWLYMRWQRWNYSVFRNAQKVFTLSESMMNAVQPYLLTSTEKKGKIIHNWADTDYIHPIPKEENAFVKKYRLEHKLIILYSGNMGHTHDLESLIDAASLLNNDQEFVFVFIGDGAKRKSLHQLAVSKSLSNVLFLPYQDSDQFPLAMAAADVGVVTLGKGAEGISVPSKTYINLAAGACVLAIAPVSSELSRLIKHHDAGIICEPGQGERIASSLKQLVESKVLLKTYQQNALKAAQYYTSRNATAYVYEIMNANHPS